LSGLTGTLKNGVTANLLGGIGSRMAWIIPEPHARALMRGGPGGLGGHLAKGRPRS